MGILEEILALIPTGINITEDIVQLINAIQNLFSNNNSATQKVVVSTLAVHLAKPATAK